MLLTSNWCVLCWKVFRQVC